VLLGSTTAHDVPPTPPDRPSRSRWMLASPHSTRRVLFPRWGPGSGRGTEMMVGIASNVPAGAHPHRAPRPSDPDLLTIRADGGTTVRPGIWAPSTHRCP
jgi:hypothetical protein